MDSKNYDLIVIGSGAGLNVANYAHENYGWKVAIVENGPLGGTCLNRGCIPSKIVIHAADVAEEIKNAGKFGINAKIESIDFAQVTNRASQMVDEDSANIEQGIRETAGVDLYKAEGSFVDQHTLRVGDEQISGDRFVIASGARPFIPPIEGIDKVGYWTSTEALRQIKQPASLIVIGGGYIAAELGHFYGSLGTKVTIVEAAPTLLSREDGDISKEFTRIFSEKHNVLLGVKAKSVSGKPGGAKIVTVELSPGQEISIEAEALLVAVGIKPNTDLLQAQKAGVEVNERGYIKVDE
ncbi:MAG: FAD-dependent oxidoreductase, partial [Patescibacteria group bacterium]